jgi:hypothetical protein
MYLGDDECEDLAVVRGEGCHSRKSIMQQLTQVLIIKEILTTG